MLYQIRLVIAFWLTWLNQNFCLSSDRMKLSCSALRRCCATASAGPKEVETKQADGRLSATLLLFFPVPNPSAECSCLFFSVMLRLAAPVLVRHRVYFARSAAGHMSSRKGRGSKEVLVNIPSLSAGLLRGSWRSTRNRRWECGRYTRHGYTTSTRRTSRYPNSSPNLQFAKYECM